jgi:transcriptional regulator with XRE-family HTH domain
MSEISAEEWRQMRLDKGWTQTELAAIAGVSSPSRISDVERGLPPGETVERRLLEALRPQQDGAVAA